MPASPKINQPARLESRRPILPMTEPVPYVPAISRSNPHQRRTLQKENPLTPTRWGEKPPGSVDDRTCFRCPPDLLRRLTQDWQHDSLTLLSDRRGSVLESGSSDRHKGGGERINATRQIERHPGDARGPVLEKGHPRPNHPIRFHSTPIARGHFTGFVLVWRD